ncbi:MAG TPA: hypothetical protein VEZ55_16825 [Chitinophagaceae bacterium]|nr:hypothetical protein [Chitinophagaceae bacterium]
MLFLALLCVMGISNVQAQGTHPQRLKVFIDCSRTRCDRAFIISEIRVVDFLLDRIASDVHVLITSQGAGGGGRQYQLIFYGQHTFKNRLDTLRFTTDPNATDSEIRDQLVHSIKLGLVPFIAKTAYGTSLKLEMKESGTLPMNTDAADRWNFWVFRVGVNGELSGERVYKSSRGSSEFSAQRTTEKLKVEFYLFGSQRKSRFEYESTSGNTDYEVKNSEYGLFHNIVRSFDAHWSYGYQASYSNNTFSNYKSRIYVNPAIEYNIYPYQQANNRFFVVRYGLDVTMYNYYDSTIYNKTDESLFGHKFSAALTLNQKWGTFNSGIFYRNYLHDWKLNSMGINVNVNVRVTGGLSFNINSSGRIVHDQVYLVKGAASEQEVLTRRRQLASSFNYNTSFGVNYRFGSKLNNFINPRFEGYGGF